MNDYVATRSDVKLTFPLVSINENYCSWNRSSITTVPYSLLLSTSLIKLRKLSENFTVPRCAHVPPIFLPENPRLLVSDSFFDRFQTKTEIPTAIVCTRHDNSFHRFTINLERHPPPESFTSTFTTSRIEYRRPIARYFHGWFTCLVHVHLSGV